MTFEEFAIVYLIVLAVFAVLDAIWLGSIAKDLYKHFLGQRLLKNPFWPAVVVFYLLFSAGLTYFAVIPGIEDKNAGMTALNGLLFGFFVYTCYGLTNLATLRRWPAGLVSVDAAWGAVASFTAAILSYSIYFFGIN